MDRIFLDVSVLSVKSELGSKTKNLDELNEYVRGIEERSKKRFI